MAEQHQLSACMHIAHAADIQMVSHAPAKILR